MAVEFECCVDFGAFWTRSRNGPHAEQAGSISIPAAAVVEAGGGRGGAGRGAGHRGRPCRRRLEQEEVRQGFQAWSRARGGEAPT